MKTYMWKAISCLMILPLFLFVSCGQKSASRDRNSERPYKSAEVDKSDFESVYVRHFAENAEEPPITHNTEDYNLIVENEFLKAISNPLSTFSIDVDTASYSNVRRFINEGRLPPKDAVRIEELINYFTYDYPEPDGEHPFSITTEASKCPWEPDHLLVQIGLHGKEIPSENLPASNLVFLLDVSGSMEDYNKLPLVQQAFHLLVDNLRSEDRVAIVVYAGSEGLLLPSTPGSEKTRILDAVDNLYAGGSTAGAAGITLAYKIAKQNFIDDGNNRVILATDGDFNVGVSSQGQLVRLIEEKRDQGIFLTVLGFGTGNYKDSKMEMLADKGNGNYAYIDNILEANKVLVREFGGTLFTIAKDVKIQVEFNPAKVDSYRLIGYENRMLKKEDFEDDTKDAGELGSGHTVTALYEIIPAKEGDASGTDDTKYTTTALKPDAIESNELMTVKFRYKEPDGDTSILIKEPVVDDKKEFADTSVDFKFAAAVAEFGLLLRDSKFKGRAAYENVVSMAKLAKGDDEEGYREEFIRLAKSAELLKR